MPFPINWSVEEIHKHTKIDPWFLNQLREIVELEKKLQAYTIESLSLDLLRECKRSGFSDQNVAEFLALSNGAKATANQVMALRHKAGSVPSIKESTPARLNSNRTRRTSIPPMRANVRRILRTGKRS